MKAVIIAGGKGTRLGSMTAEIPKPLVKINNLSILEHQIRFLKREGITELIILTGHLGQKISDFVGDGSRLGVNIECIREAAPLGTAGCLDVLRNRIQADFLLVYGDVILDIFLERFVSFHRRKQSIATLFVHPNDHPRDSDLVEVDDHSFVKAFIPKTAQKGRSVDNLVNAALYVLSPAIFDFIRPENIDFIKDVFPAALQNGHLVAAYRSPEYIKDVGTPARINQVGRHLTEGLVAARNLRFAQKAIFLDRDGTINEEVGLLNRVEQVKLIPGVANAIREINQSGFLAVCVTNQSVIARNLCTIDELHKIHQRMAELLGEAGAYLDRIFFCPHHPDKGYPEERPEFKIDCDCRKPNPGMLIQARQELNIDLSQSYMVGDRTGDIELGRRSGLKTVLLKTGSGGGDGKYVVEPDFQFPSMEDAVFSILKKNGIDSPRRH